MASENVISEARRLLYELLIHVENEFPRHRTTKFLDIRKRIEAWTGISEMTPVRALDGPTTIRSLIDQITRQEGCTVLDVPIRAAPERLWLCRTCGHVMPLDAAIARQCPSQLSGECPLPPDVF